MRQSHYRNQTEMTDVSQEDRAKIIARLQQYLTNLERNPNIEYTVCALAQDLAPMHATRSWLVMHELARIGVVIPGQPSMIQFYANNIQNYKNKPEYFNWPFFTITPFGKSYLKGEVATTTSCDANGYISILKGRMPTLPEALSHKSDWMLSQGPGKRPHDKQSRIR